MRLLLFCTVLVFTPFTAVRGAEPAQVIWPATVKLDTVTARPGEQAGIPIRLVNNDREFSALQIPLRIVSPFLRFDSVSFAGSIMTPQFTGLVNAPSGESDSVDITLVPDFVSPLPTIAVEEGLIATLWVTVEATAAPGPAIVDSVAIDTVINDGGEPAPYWKILNGSDPSGTLLLPGFVPGGVWVETATDAGDIGQDALPADFSLGQNYPNPFNPITVIEFSIPRAAQARLAVYNVLGQETAVLFEGQVGVGTHRVMFDGEGHPSGIYFYRLSHEGGAVTRKMTLIK